MYSLLSVKYTQNDMKQYLIINNKFKKKNDGLNMP